MAGELPLLMIPEDARRLVKRAMRRVTGSGGIQVQDSDDGVAIAWRGSGPAAVEGEEVGVVVQLTSAAAGGEKYNGKLAKGQIAGDPAPNLAWPEGMTFGATDDALVYNLAGLGSGHTLATGETHLYPGLILGATAEKPPRAVVGIYVATPAGIRPCTVTQSGGSNGTTTTAPSYTYLFGNDAVTGAAIKNADGSTPAAQSPTWGRDKGDFAVATHGTYYISASTGNPVLWQVDEIETVCT